MYTKNCLEINLSFIVIEKRMKKIVLKIQLSMILWTPLEARIFSKSLKENSLNE